MCTRVLLRHVHPEWPLVLAANRDERYARPASGAALLSHAPRIIGGRDLERQGTWMGVTDGGLFVGLTNQRVSEDLARSPRSRGEVVLQALETGSVEGVERYVARLDPRDFLSCMGRAPRPSSPWPRGEWPTTWPPTARRVSARTRT